MGEPDLEKVDRLLSPFDVFLQAVRKYAMLLFDRKNPLLSARQFNIILLSAVMIFVMYPTAVFGELLPDLGFVAWVYLVPLVVIFYRADFTRRLLGFWLAHFLGYLASIYWFMIAMQNYGNLPLLPALAGLVLAALILSVMMAVPLALGCWVKSYSKLPLFILLPVFALLADFIFEFAPFGGYPWLRIVHTQGQWLRFFQWIDHSGSSGLSLYIYLVNALVAEGLVGLIHHKQMDKLVSRALIVFMLALVSLYLSSLASQNFERGKKTIASLDVALIQGNIDQENKWDPYQAQGNLQHYLHVTNVAVKNGAQLVFWPETAYPYGLYADDFGRESFLEQGEMPVPLLIGAIVYDRSGGKLGQYNAVIHVNREAQVQEAYYKMHLVPFGEYLPYGHLFDFLGPLLGEIGTFAAGADFTTFAVKGVHFGSLICFEDLFMENSRQMVRQGADVLVNFTNDAWYARSSAIYHHLVPSQLRALENRRTLLRVTNTGLTAVIAPNGEVLESLAPFNQAYLLHPLKVEVGEAPFTRHGGNWLRYVVLFTLLVFVYTFVKCLLGPVRVEE